MAVINATDLKNGKTFVSYGEPFRVIKYSLIKMGRGGAIVKLQVRNLLTGAVSEKSYSSNVKVEDITTTKRKLQFLYQDGSVCTFMDGQTYDQVEISASVLKDELPYIKEGQDVDVLFWEDKALSVDIAPKVTLEVVDTPPGIKGNSVSNMYKDAKLSNGLSVRVPLFIENGEKIIIDTRTGNYVERAKKT